MSNNEEGTKSEGKKLTIKLTLGLKSLSITLVGVLALLAAFYAGWHFGGDHQKNISQNTAFSSDARTPFVQHKALVGTINKVNGAQIVVQLNNKQTQSSAISSSTSIRNTKGQTVNEASLKVGDRVIVTAIVNNGGSLLAQNILVID